MKRSQVWYGLSGIAVLTLAIISGCTRNLTVAPTAPAATATSTVAGPTSTFTRTNTPGFSSTFTTTATRTSSPTATASPTNTNTTVPGATNTFTTVATDTPTATVTPTLTATLTATSTASATNTNTNVPGATDTFTSTVTATSTTTSTATATATTATCQAASLQSAYSFDSSLDCWMIDSGSTAKATSLDISGTHTYSGAGAMHAVISNAASTSAQFNLVYSAAQNFTGKGISVWVYVDASMVGASVQLYTLSGASGSTWGAGGWTNFTASNVGTWVQVSYIPSAADISQVQQFGIQFYNLTASTTGNVYMDNLKIADSCNASSVITSYPFDSGTQCWHADSGSAAVMTDVGITTTQKHSGTGAMYATVVEGSTATNIQFDLNYSPTQNLTGYTVSAWVYVPSSFIGCSGQIFMQSGNSGGWTWANNVTAVTFDATNTNQWVNITFDPSTVATWNAADFADVSVWGVQFYGVPANASGTVYVDDVSLVSATTNTPTRTPTSGDTPTITSTPTVTLTPTDTFTTVPGATDTFTSTVTPTFTVTETPTATTTPTATVSSSTPCSEMIESFESTTENGAWAAVDHCTLSYSGTNATLGSTALQANITTGGGANILSWTSFAPSAWTNVTKVVMDINADASLVTGTYNQLSLVENSAAGGYWSPITDNADIVAGQQSVTFTIHWSLGSLNGTTPMNKLLLVWNTSGTGTGNISIDNIRLVGTTTACPPTVPSTCGLIESFESTTENGSWAAVDHCTLSYSGTNATLGATALQADVTTGGGANILAWSNFSPSAWTNVTQVIMDVNADASLVTGTYNQLSLVENSAAGGYWSPITDNADIVAGQQSVTFTIHWSLGSVTDTTPMGKLLLVWNTSGTGTGNISIDNIRLKSGASCTP